MTTRMLTDAKMQESRDIKFSPLAHP